MNCNLPGRREGGERRGDTVGQRLVEKVFEGETSYDLNWRVQVIINRKIKRKKHKKPKSQAS